METAVYVMTELGIMGFSIAVAALLGMCIYYLDRRQDRDETESFTLPSPSPAPLPTEAAAAVSAASRRTQPVRAASLRQRRSLVKTS